MKVSTVIFSAIALVPTFAHEGYHQHHHAHHDAPLHDHNALKPHTHIAYHHVESACAADVERWCSEPGEEIPQTLGDPLLDWIFLPLAPPPSETRDLESLMNSMIPLIPVTTRVSIWWIEDLDEEKAPEIMMDSMVAKLASEKEPEEIPQLAQDLQEHGRQILEMSNDIENTRQSMARRLMEVTPEQLHRVHLPFGYPKNKCLMEAVANDQVSDGCAHSIRELEHIFRLETDLDQQQQIFIGMMWLYIAVLSLLLMLLARKYHFNRGQRRLRIRILQAVYSNPELKRQVEEELGESVGTVPPLPRYALRMMSRGGKTLKRRMRCMKRLHFLLFSILLTLVFVAPFYVLPICIFVSLVRIAQLCSSSSTEEPDCTCCCCGASPRDAVNGTLTDAQVCCNCCKGTGVCAPSCADCCGPDGCSCCGSDGCCCKGTKMIKSGCCCCEASPDQVASGGSTTAQDCCSCCSGTGACSSNCECCCSGNSSLKKGRGQKHILASKQAIWEGVPMQVV